MIFSSSAFQFTLRGILCSPFKTTAGKSNYIGSSESQPLSLYQCDLERAIYVIACLAFLEWTVIFISAIGFLCEAQIIIIFQAIPLCLLIREHELF